MENTNLQALLEGRDIRANLIAIRQQVKNVLKESVAELNLRSQQGDSPAGSDLCAQLLEQTDFLCGLMGTEDAKIRKNAALILGEIGAQKAMDALCQAYVSENTLFVRPAYLEAMGQLDYRSAIPVLTQRLEIIDRMVMAPDEKKHLTQERHLLAELVDMVSGSGGHTFCDRAVPSKVILTVRRGREDILYNEINRTFPGIKPVKMAGGISLSVKRPPVLLRLRTFSGMLFCFCRENGFAKDGDVLSRAVMDAKILDYLDARHDGDGAWRFRIDVHTRDDVKVKAALAKKMALGLEGLGHGRFVNSVSDYEIEFVLMEGRDGRVFVYLKLHTMADERFSYRQNFVASSMNPVTAAQMIACAAPYFKDNANVLDPFCGVGTLLIERKLQGPPLRALYGVDIYGKAIDGGRENARLAGIYVNFIQREFLDFTHEYLFDEIITDMPDRFETQEKKEQFYMEFFCKCKGHLSDGGRLFIHCGEEALIRQVCRRYQEFSMIFSVLLSEKTKTGVFILEIQKNYK